MKLPNFRLYDTQATFSMVAALCGVVILLIQSVLVFHGLNTSPQWVIPYNPDGRGQYRPILIMIVTAVAVMVGVTAGILGFRSLGQSRNTKQGRSWMGMLIGALVISASPVMFYAWKTMSEAVILKQSL